MRDELASEAASLRAVVAEQGAAVAALRHHAERMEAQAETANAQVRIGVIFFFAGQVTEHWKQP